MPTRILQQLQTLFESCYDVPWCVPPWGWRELAETLRAVFTARVVHGARTATFVAATRDRLNRRYGLGFNRGRTAITVALTAMNVGRGADVIVPAHICRSVVEAVAATGARVVYADVGADAQVSLETVQSALTPATRCVIVAHLYGNAAEVDRIENALAPAGIAVIDDAAQSFGAIRVGRPVGSRGRCAVVCCGPGKALAGAGGAVLLTDDPSVYEAAVQVRLPAESASAVARRTLAYWVWRRLRRYTLPLAIVLNRVSGWQTPIFPGEAARLSNLEAAIAWRQSQSAERNAARRREHAKAALACVEPYVDRVVSDLSPGAVVTKLVVVLRADVMDPDAFIRSMQRAGLECQRGYDLPSGVDSERLPMARTLAQHSVCIPVDRPPPVERMRRVFGTIDRARKSVEAAAAPTTDPR